MTTGEGYSHPEFLVDAEWVVAHQNDPNVVVVDTDVEAAYLRGHIAGSVMVTDNYEKDPDSGRVHILPPDKFAVMCQNLGIGDETLVIAYDNNQSLYAARLWWALNYYGHTNVKVLDGGWRRWVQEGRAISFDRPKAPASVKFTSRVNDSIMVKVDDLKAACSLSDAVIWDVRSDGEYDGSNGRGNKRVGHVPGAVHLEWFNLMDRDTHRFKPAEEVRPMLAKHGLTPDKAVFAY
jgi:thiosulfate/3-mercaptopyruvate sulfurtransferase